MYHILAKIDGIILAAGLSKRANSYKMTLNIGGKTLIENCIESMYDVCSKIIIVGGYRVENLVPVVEKYPKIKLVVNENYMEGMYSSIKEGLKHVRGDRFFLTPGDYPVIQKNVYDTMSQTDSDIVVPVYNGKKGHPVLIKSYLIKEICQNSVYSNLREYIGSKGFTSVTVNDKGILMDVDTMEDYNMACKHIYKPMKGNLS